MTWAEEAIQEGEFPDAEAGGQSHEVRHPECLAIGKSQIAITAPDADRVAVFSLVHVTGIEFL